MSDSHIRNLPVPYYSQRENDYIWQEREPKKKKANGIEFDNPNAGKILYWKAEDEAENANHKAGQPKGQKKLFFMSCNITCITMVLHYLGITELMPDDLMKLAFESTDERVINMINKLGVSKTEPLSPDILTMNQFAPAFVNSFFGNMGVNATADFQFSTDLKMEKAIATGIPFILRVGTNQETEKLDTDEELSDFLENITISYKKRVDMGNGFTWSKFCDDKTIFNDALKVIKDEISSEKEKKQARERVEKIRIEYINARLAPGMGHFIVVRGYTEDEVIINDPWGEPGRDENGNIVLTDAGRWCRFPEIIREKFYFLPK